MPAVFKSCNYWAGPGTAGQHYLQPTLNQACGQLPTWASSSGYLMFLHIPPVHKIVSSPFLGFMC